MYPDASASQIHSWEVLINDVKTAPSFGNIPDTAVIAFELALFVENMSADLVIAGSTPTGETVAFLIESKQWGDYYIRTNRYGTYRETNELLHPRVQVYHHFLALRDYIKTEPAISHIRPCVYMRNASEEGCTYLCRQDPNISSLEIPVFNNINEIFDIIANSLTDTTALSVRSFREATYCPSVSIIDAISAIVTQEVPFILTDEQERTLMQILDLISSGKRIIQINGGAGSGKTAILLNIYVRMIRRQGRFLPLFVSGAQNTYLYKSLYPAVAGTFNFSFTVRNTVRNIRDRIPIVLLDEAQHNQAGIISEILSNPLAKVILCYDEWQTINADNALAELESFRTRDDFASIALHGSVRFQGSQVFESNVKAYLCSARMPIPDEAYDFRIIPSFEELKRQTHSIIRSHPDQEIALMGLLSNDAHEIAQSSDGFIHIGWNNKYETSWVPYIKRKNYLSQNNGSLWVGTWWMPGLDIDYAVLIVGNDAKMTPNGFVGVPEYSKNYLMIISIAKQLGLPENIIDANTSHSNKVTAILNYLDLPQNTALKETFHNDFTFYLRNMYYVMMTRGRKGCLVYFKNQGS